MSMGGPDGMHMGPGGMSMGGPGGMSIGPAGMTMAGVPVGRGPLGAANAAVPRAEGCWQSQTHTADGVTTTRATTSAGSTVFVSSGGETTVRTPQGGVTISADGTIHRLGEAQDVDMGARRARRSRSRSRSRSSSSSSSSSSATSARRHERCGGKRKAKQISGKRMMKQLADMGFTNVDLNLQLIELHGQNMQAILRSLLSEQ
mmetsp:Transcript_6998/g.14977  ORF Transcript_6998/g.14977 Transcript_6998/m.14977 type:complete len:203 (+) Transcript_6998:1-609(+)